MPAVKAFALYAGMALLLDFLLQITCFIGLLSLDTSRQENNRLDICCCIQIGKKKEPKEAAAAGAEGPLYKLFQHAYAPFLMSKPIRAVVCVVFFGWLCASIAVAPNIDVGLDQELSMPEDSYMLKYFQVINSFASGFPKI